MPEPMGFLYRNRVHRVQGVRGGVQRVEPALPPPTGPGASCRGDSYAQTRGGSTASTGVTPVKFIEQFGEDRSGGRWP